MRKRGVNLVRILHPIIKQGIIPLATPPAADAFADAFVFAGEVPGAPSRARRPFVAVMPAHARRDIAQEGLVVGLQGHVSMDIIPPIPRLKYH